MTLARGSRLGPYEIVEPLGAGGMGEVYRAKDTRLERDVAVKVLPAELASDPERLRRFEKEARSASALNHPNIVTIYDIGSEGGVSYIAMERVEGQTLRELLVSGPMAVKKLLGIGTQIAEGLAKAHEAGIVHRDLKPENVMVTRDGLVKILDFGLAKLTSTMSGSGEGSQLPTMTGTTPGVVVGTVGYMSPEQVSGVALDFRSDQFALGSILYEMATGKRAFQKKTAIDTLAAILNEEPEPITAINPQIPAPLRWIVERCLVKEPEGRYSATRDVAKDLAMVRDRLGDIASSGAMAARKPRPLRSLWVLVVAAGLVVLVAGLFAARSLWSKASPPPSFRRLTFRNGVIEHALFAPDGQTIIYSAQWKGEDVAIFTTRAGSVESRSLGPPGADLLSVSPAGEMLVLRGETLARAALAGGGEREILESVQDASWAPNGKDIAVVRGAGKVRLEFPIGKVLVESNGGLSSPRVAPQGDLVAFLEHPLRGDNRGWLAVSDLRGKKRRLSEEFNAIQGTRWAAGGREIWFSGASAGTSMAIYGVTLSGRQRLVARGPGDQELQDVSPDGRALMSHWHSRGVLMTLPPGESGERDLSWLDMSSAADLSDDGKTLLIVEQGEGAGSLTYSAWLRKTDASPAVRLGDGLACGLSPDGKWALTVRFQPPPAQIVLLPTGAGEAKTVTHDSISHRIAAWFPDGKRILFAGTEPGKGVRLYVQDLDGGAPHPIGAEMTGRAFWIRRPVSPDGRKVVAFDGERFVLYPVNGGEPTPVAGLHRGETPIRWSADGRFLYIQEQREPPTIRIVRLDPTTGRRGPWKEIPTQLRGQVLLSADGKSYAINSTTASSDLYLVEGLR